VPIFVLYCDHGVEITVIVLIGQAIGGADHRSRC